MLTLPEKQKVKDVLSDGLGIRRDINLAFYLDRIRDTSEKVSQLETRLNQIIYNQQCLDRKLDAIINILNSRL